MKSLGAKSAGLGALSFMAMMMALRQGRLNAAYIEHLTPHAALFLGAFSILLTAAFTGLFGLREPSRSHFRLAFKGQVGEYETPLVANRHFALLIGKNHQCQVWDAPSPVRKILCFSISFFIVLLCITDRTADLIDKVPRKVMEGGLYCPSGDAASTKADEPRAGCALIEKAFKLGLVKSKGSCAPKQEDEVPKLCTLRQRDEPLLHYSARLLMDFVSGAGSGWEHAPFWEKVAELFKERWGHFGFLFGHMAHVVASTPGSATHIFTNLPYPTGPLAALWNQWFRKNRCSPVDRSLSRPRFDDSAAGGPGNKSQIFRRIFNQLLFDTEFDPPVGLCQEFTVHWNSPADACARLAHDPETFLRHEGLTGQIKEIINRYDDQLDITRLQIKLTSISTGRPPPLPPAPSNSTFDSRYAPAGAAVETILGFSCFMEAPKARQPFVARDMPFKLFGHVFQAREVDFSGNEKGRDSKLDVYKDLSEAFVTEDQLAGSTAVNGPLSPFWKPGPEVFSSDDFPLSRLEFLKNTDIFSGNSWLQERTDLLEVYPYYNRLEAFIKAFRRAYLARWTRL